MSARIGDRLRIGGDGGTSGGLCTVLEIREDNGPRMYLVEWTDTGTQGFVIPGDEGTVVPGRLPERRGPVGRTGPGSAHLIRHRSGPAVGARPHREFPVDEESGGSARPRCVSPAPLVDRAPSPRGP